MAQDEPTFGKGRKVRQEVDLGGFSCENCSDAAPIIPNPVSGVPRTLI